MAAKILQFPKPTVREPIDVLVSAFSLEDSEGKWKYRTEITARTFVERPVEPTQPKPKPSLALEAECPRPVVRTDR